MEIFPINTCNILKLPNERYLCTPFQEPGIDINFQQSTQETGNKWQNKMAYAARSYILNKKRWEFQLLTQYHMQVKQLLFYFNFKARTGRQSKMPKMFASGSLDVRMQQ